MSAVEDRELLSSGCRELGTELDEGQLGRMLAYLDLLYVWNRNAGLTTIPREKAVRLHLLDSLAAAGLVEGPRCVDLGSGAGLPGIPLAIAKPGLHFTLVESNRRRCSFMMEALRQLRLDNAVVLEKDADRVEGRFQTVLSRAYRQPADFLRSSVRLMAPGGQILLLLADVSSSELDVLAEGAGLQLEQVRRARLPGGDEKRCIASLRARAT